MASRRHNPPVDHDACGVGFIAQLGNAPASREVIDRALTALLRLSHRGGVDADGSSGDGAGLLIPIPSEFFRARARESGIDLPDEFGLGMVFLPRERPAAACSSIEALAERFGLRCLGWRDVPADPAVLGPSAAESQPVIRQCFFAGHDPSGQNLGQRYLEQRLFLFRKRVEAAAATEPESEATAEIESLREVYFASLSSHSIVYKGLLAPQQLPKFYGDLAHHDFHVQFAVFHQRYSTNTQPTWRLAQPFRFIAHNGEINTIGANRRWMHAREKDFRAQLGADDGFRALEERVSDSASFDNAFELLARSGYTPGAAMLRMVPPAWEASAGISPELRDFLALQAREQEPWDGPAALVFSDGRVVGAKLDRNGLRPLRYTVTTDGLVVLGSEVGLATLDGKKIIERERLGPGEMLVVDPGAGTILRGDELSRTIVRQSAAIRTLANGNGSGHAREKQIVVDRKPRPHASAGAASTTTRATSATPAATPATNDAKRLAAALGWTDDQFRILFQPLGLDGKEAIWSMGDDAPPAFLSSARRPLWDYCKQSFAQVTNPPIDPLREALTMSLETYLGAHVTAKSPLLDAFQMAALEDALVGPNDRPICRIDFTFDAPDGVLAAQQALARVQQTAREAVGTPVDAPVGAR
ncbi:MAG: glutamate synthase central domain-containing protein, partial [Candidatus Acidiferrales bacterium]